MSNREERAGKSIVDAFKLLPDEKKEFLLGYAEGVKAASKPHSVPETTEEEEERADRQGQAWLYRIRGGDKDDA